MDYFQRMKTIQNFILEYLDTEEDDEHNFDRFAKLLNFQQTQPDAQEFKSILYLISKITENHHRGPLFFDKIKKIIIYLKKEIKQTFSNTEIFNIFKNSKRILLLLIDEDILIYDSNISEKNKKYKSYFDFENNKLNNNDQSIELPENFEENRRKGENDSYICLIIRDDNIEEFSTLYAKNEITPYMTINPSIYETNSFLEDKSPTLIEYSAFFGSIQIFRFLYQNQITLTLDFFFHE